MNVRGSMRAHPWRWLAAALLVLVVVTALATLLLARALLQPQRFTQLLQSQLSDAGLTLSVDKPASPTLWPHPAVQLEGFRLGRNSASTPLLAASEARIVVSWRSLLHRNLAIERLEIQSPRIDLDQLQALLASLPTSEGAPQLPHIGAGLKITDGVLLQDGQPLLFDFDAATGRLLQGEPFHLSASARNGVDNAGSVVLDALPRSGDDGIGLDDIHLDVRINGGPQARLAGTARWRGGRDVSANLQGKLTLPAQASPSSAAGASVTHTGASTPPTPTLSGYALALHIEPARGVSPLTIAFKLDGADQHVDARIPPIALASWWRDIATAQSGKPLALPPLEGQAQVGEIGYGALHLRGVRIEAGAKVAPIADDDTPKPAGTAAVPNSGAAH